jgi:potassium-transporting ATPase KdpC subunit
MFKELRTAFVVLLVLTILTGVIYPFAVTGIAQAVFPGEANGSLVMQGDVVRGSHLIGQPFDDAKYFWSRPSATSPVPYNAASSSGSNLGPTNPDLAKALKERVEKLRATPGGDATIPADLVTSSGSGLDPHISPAAARFQVARVAAARGLEAERVARLVEEHVEGRWLGLLGEPRVNVLELNLALDHAPKR